MDGFSTNIAGPPKILPVGTGGPALKSSTEINMQRSWTHLFCVCYWQKTQRPPIYATWLHYTGWYMRSGISLVHLWFKHNNRLICFNAFSWLVLCFECRFIHCTPKASPKVYQNAGVFPPSYSINKQLASSLLYS